MRLPNQTTSGETLQSTYGLYHLTRLKADPECTDLATAFQAAQDQLKTRLDQHGAARANAMTALAVRDAQNAALGRQVRGFCLAVLARVNNNRRTALYQTYFPSGLRAVISAPIDVELTRVGSMLAKLNEETDPQLTAYFEPLQAAAESMRAAFEAHRAAMDTEVNAFGLLRAESIRWGDAYRRSYRDLQRKFYQDGDHAESFFRSPTVTRGASQGEEAMASGGVAIPPGGHGASAASAALSVTPDIAAIRSAAPALEVADAA
jgi:hypothetical protein